MEIHQRIHTIDLKFTNSPGIIAAYLIPYDDKAILIECGPGSTLTNLKTGLQTSGYSIYNITDVFLTHIHLDHAGAAGWFARHGAKIHVHAVGAPHLIDPTKLLLSASRIYGDQMEPLWGKFLPVPASQISILCDGDTVVIGGLQIKAIETPGHAEHHLVYIFDDTIFTGDIGGVRISRHDHIKLPMPPPEFHLEKWQESIRRLKTLNVQNAALTHFGIFPDAMKHFDHVDSALAEIGFWINQNLPRNPPPEDIHRLFVLMEDERSEQFGLDTTARQLYDLANPTSMSANGIQRYWKKYREANY